MSGAPAIASGGSIVAIVVRDISSVERQVVRCMRQIAPDRPPIANVERPIAPLHAGVGSLVLADKVVLAPNTAAPPPIARGSADIAADAREMWQNGTAGL